MRGRHSAKLTDENEITPQSNYVDVYDDGRCYWEPRYELSISQCPVDVTWFPFDEQTCNLTFESWGLDRYSLNILTTNRSLDFDNLIPPDGWRLVGTFVVSLEI